MVPEPFKRTQDGRIGQTHPLIGLDSPMVALYVRSVAVAVDGDGDVATWRMRGLIPN